MIICGVVKNLTHESLDQYFHDDADGVIEKILIMILKKTRIDNEE